MEQRSSTSSPPRAGRRRWGHAQLDAARDTYKTSKKPHEPTVCAQCGAVFHAGRWQWSARPADAEEGNCPACLRTTDHYPAGILTLSGKVVATHKDEVIRLARHQEEAEKQEHPLNRIIDIEDHADRIVINTTDIHLPRRIAEAMKRAWHGKTDYHYEEDGYFVRATWHHDD